MKIKISSKTDVGKERVNNEDAFTYCLDVDALPWSIYSEDYVPLGELGAVSIVADGMGGANAGEVASGIAVSCLENAFQDRLAISSLHSEKEIHDFLASAIEKVNEGALSYVEENLESAGMGTTIVVAWLLKDQIHIAWCGDSRCYRFNPASGLVALTKDHSYVQELIDRKEISEEETIGHPDAHLITRCLGDVDASSVPEVKTFKVNAGDVFLLCSDGLCGYCSDGLIERIMFKCYTDVVKCTNELVSLALNSGGYDNITVSVISTLHDNAFAPHLSMRGKIRQWLPIIISNLKTIN